MGYHSMQRSIHSIEELLEIVNRHVSKSKYGENPPNLYEPIDYIMSLGGKRMRPLLVLLAYQLKGEEVQAILDPALAVEVFHNFTLMHDDIMDEAPLRRGKPTVHEKWNQTVAILAGDAMLIKAYDALLEVPKDIFPVVVKRFNKTALEVCEGQQIDMNFEALATVSEQDYLEMIRLKTAVLLGFSMEFGGMLAGLPQDQVDQLYDVGEKMGIGFQLMDDYLDVYADKAKFGKQVGGDIISNKKTYLLINALELANSDQKQALDKWLAYQGDDTDSKVEGVKKIYDEIGIPNLAKMKMNYYFDQAIKTFQGIEGNEEAKQVLIAFAEKLMKRER